MAKDKGSVKNTEVNDLLKIAVLDRSRDQNRKIGQYFQTRHMALIDLAKKLHVGQHSTEAAIKPSDVQTLSTLYKELEPLQKAVEEIDSEVADDIGDKIGEKPAIIKTSLKEYEKTCNGSMTEKSIIEKIKHLMTSNGQEVSVPSSSAPKKAPPPVAPKPTVSDPAIQQLLKKPLGDRSQAENKEIVEACIKVMDQAREVVLTPELTRYKVALEAMKKSCKPEKRPEDLEGAIECLSEFRTANHALTTASASQTFSKQQGKC